MSKGKGQLPVHSVNTAEELEAFAQRHWLMESAALQFNAMTVDGNTARFWRAYQLAREAGGAMPEPVLRVLDDVAARLLAEGATDDDRLRAIGFPRRRRGQRALASLTGEPKKYELCSMLWLQATGGQPGEAPPARMPPGVYEAVARRLRINLDAKAKARWKADWSRFARRWKTGGPERQDMSNALQAMLRTWGGDKR